MNLGDPYKEIVHDAEWNEINPEDLETSSDFKLQLKLQEAVEATTPPQQDSDDPN
jgi:hypothetical protein